MALDSVSRTQSMKDIVGHLCRLLEARETTSPTLFPDLSVYLSALPFAYIENGRKERRIMKQLSVKLWNLCNKYSVANDDKTEGKTIAEARALSFLLLLSVTKVIEAVNNKMLDCAMKTIGECIKNLLLELAHKLFEHVTDRYSRFLDAKSLKSFESQPDTHTYVRYNCLRIALEWKRGRNDLANNWYDSASWNNSSESSSAYEFAIDLFYEIGSDLLNQHQYEDAVKWLSRAERFLHIENVPAVCSSDPEMSLNILHTLARALFSQGDLCSIDHLEQIVSYLRKSHGHLLAVQLLQLELLEKSPGANLEAFVSELGAIIRSVHLLDGNHKMILHYIHKLRACETSRALECLELYIAQRLIPDENEEWIDATIVTFVSIAITPPGKVYPQMLEHLQKPLDSFLQAYRPLSLKAANAIMVLLWKHINLDSQAVSDIQTWCEIGLHKLFRNMDDQNIGKLERKLVTCHLEAANFKHAKAVLDDISQDQSGHNLNLYLAYCIAIRSKDDAEAQSLFQKIVSMPEKEHKLLYACVAETMKFGSTVSTARCLQRFMDKFAFKDPPGVDICALVRYTARLLTQAASDSSPPSEEILTRVCAIYKHAVVCSKRSNHEDGVSGSRLSGKECEWFEYSSFDIAVKHLQVWPFPVIIDLLEYSTHLCYPEVDLFEEPNQAQKINFHKERVVYIQAILYVCEARRCEPGWTHEDIPKTSYNHRSRPSQRNIAATLYRNVFDRYGQLHKIYSSQADSGSHSNRKEELQCQLQTLLPLCFEALLFMTSEAYLVNQELIFDDVGLCQLIEQAVQLESPPGTYAQLADMILVSSVSDDTRSTNQRQTNRSHIPISNATKLLSKIVNGLRTLDVYSITKAARWIRCITQLLIEHIEPLVSPRDINAGTPKHTDTPLPPPASLAFLLTTLSNITSQALDLARTDGVTTTHYPQEELEWLSTTLFNLCIDLYLHGDETDAKRCAQAALQVADVLTRSDDEERTGNDDGTDHVRGNVCGDGGLLARTLRGRIAQLGWNASL